MSGRKSRVEVRRQGDVAGIVFDAPPSNIFDFTLLQDLSTALVEAADAPLWIFSSNLRDFSAGVDIKIHTREHSPDMLRHFHDAVRSIYHHDGITISRIHGNALGGGMELALACDFIFAHSSAKVGFPEIHLACFPPIASVLLPRKIGLKASKYLYTGEIIDAGTAEEIGLVESVFNETPEELIDTIRQHSLTSMRILKKVLRRTSGFDFDAELGKAEQIYLTELVHTEDMEEGISAFLQKRKPHFRNR